ncbi:MAG: hypothetical protein K0S05_3092 [Agromyces sp.]|jgi:DNA invertase Pin-like site-specific DNA recombinase|nr:hypothetical protein [Agromyces sp.]
MTFIDEDAPCVLVRTDLRPSTFRAFEAEAKRRKVTVAELLSTLADAAVRRRRKPAADFDARIRALNEEGLSDNRIAKCLGISQSTVSGRRRRLGLESPTPRAEGSGRRAGS